MPQRVKPIFETSCERPMQLQPQGELVFEHRNMASSIEADHIPPFVMTGFLTRALWPSSSYSWQTLLKRRNTAREVPRYLCSTSVESSSCDVGFTAVGQPREMKGLRAACMSAALIFWDDNNHFPQLISYPQSSESSLHTR
jgi:hypothetical protein